MKIDLDAVINDLEGNALQIEGKALNLKKVCTEALLQISDAATATGEEKLKRFTLALKVAEGGIQEFVVEDLAKIKELIGKAYATLVVGRAYKALNTAAPEPAPVPTVTSAAGNA